jgi:hypothetical protein
MMHRRPSPRRRRWRNVGNPEKAAAPFAEDGVFGLPFFVSLGLPTRFKSPVGVKGVLTTVLDYYPDFEFNDEDITVLIDTPKQVFAEYVTHARAAATVGPTTYSWAASSPRTARSRCCARP